jgi:YD repeat-containing protein
MNVQRSGDSIEIKDDGIFHYAAGPNGTTTTNLTRSVLFERDGEGRITAIRDPNSGSNGLPVLRYVYHAERGNLLQVHRLTDRAAGTYLMAKYHYDEPRWPHYITSIENPLGVPVARNEYDDSGRLTAIVDADGNRTEFQHSTSNNLEVVVDRLGHTNFFAYDLRGNVTATTNALGGIRTMGYDEDSNQTNEVAYLNGAPYATNRWAYTAEGFLRSQTDPLQHTVSFLCNTKGQVTNGIDARGFGTTNHFDPVTGNLTGTVDALGHATTNVYDSRSLLAWSRDAVGTITTNTYNDLGDLSGSAVLPGGGGSILSTNSFEYDANGNRTSEVVWRRVDDQRQGATNRYILDAQNRVVQAIDPLGYTNTVVYNEIGKQAETMDKLGRVTSHDYDWQGRLVRTEYPDLNEESSGYDPAGNRTNSVDPAGRSTLYNYDALGRRTNVVYPDLAQTFTFYDDLARVRFTADARGTTNAFGYDASGRRTSVTNAWGRAEQMAYGYGFDPNGSHVWSLDPSGAGTTNVFDEVNRLVEVRFADGTRKQTGFDASGRRVAETNEDNVVTLFGLDGAGRLTSVTNALGSTNEMVTRYEYDEAGNQTAQVDALGRTNRFGYDVLARRIWHTLPDGTNVERFAFDAVGNLILHTNFNGVVITNQYDAMNRLTNRASVNGYQVSFAYGPSGERTNMTDPSGSTRYSYDSRDQLTNKVVSWSGGPVLSLNYAYDPNSNVTNIWSSTTVA